MTYLKKLSKPLAIAVAVAGAGWLLHKSWKKQATTSSLSAGILFPLIKATSRQSLCMKVICKEAEVWLRLGTKAYAC